MRELTTDERDFFEGLLKYQCRLHKGYYIFRPKVKKYGNVRYKRSRINFQLHYNILLSIHDLIHHKDRDKTNDSIDNLQLTTIEEHPSLHHPVLKQIIINKIIPYNKLPDSTINRIKELTKDFKKVNCSDISRRLKIEGIKVSSHTIKKYL